jgi:hypothetical protein
MGLFVQFYVITMIASTGVRGNVLEIFVKGVVNFGWELVNRVIDLFRDCPKISVPKLVLFSIDIKQERKK